MSLVQCFKAGRLWRVRGHLMSGWGFVRQTKLTQPFAGNEAQYHAWKRGWWAAHWWMISLKKTPDPRGYPCAQ